ncbi:MAG TPA: A/G-specific adenine glycosylase [Methylotenera sp.]|nr:A/G-specific adenine glycosylase [Methylotenera sp.]HPH04594.1 A/G-specific adenine glycosylase [Methylotenera sp.]HPN00731.1 A/G-specific adenine glycosylase [Methylotenera sp.]
MTDFALRVIAWQKQHGRHDLPWQNTINPYVIWVSEIMLQQTQVTAVIGYFLRFMVRFPDIASLANATQEEVLQYWSGLGYYSRARNLHQAAQKITRDFSGIFPHQFSDILSLSGIGRSTAAAISTFAFNIPQPILDGNVKRVFARHFLIEGWTGTPKIEAQLWQIAELHMPTIDASPYTQGLMDLGATICTRTKPKCQVCPLLSSCGAYIHKRESKLPTPKPRKPIPLKQTTMLILRCGNEILLEKRPSNGIWGGLWSFPEIEAHEIATEIAYSKFGLNVEPEEPLENIEHAFTHFKLAITPQPLIVLYQPKRLVSNTIWLPIEDAIDAAIPAPVRGILNKLNMSQS